MRDDWFLKWFFRILVVSLIFIFWLASSVYSSSWENYLKQEVVGDKTVWYDNSILLQTPYRAMDPAGVEISIYDRAPGITDYTKLTLVIDENPTPCCATFEFWNIVPHIMTNIRVNAYTDIRVISENNYDALRYNKQYIKAAGGCSAPPVLTSDKPFGTINLIQSNGWTKIKIWHPNFSGMQFNQLTRSEIPAEYIDKVQMWVDDKLVWEYNGTIGIAQDVFFMMPIYTEGKHVRVYAKDNLGNEFEYDNTY
tara:strand:+ start:215 stop:970 length:756 start_codon:yes stop_codon:yes gene_type:complete